MKSTRRKTKKTNDVEITWAVSGQARRLAHPGDAALSWLSLSGLPLSQLVSHPVILPLFGNTHPQKKMTDQMHEKGFWAKLPHKHTLMAALSTLLYTCHPHTFEQRTYYRFVTLWGCRDRRQIYHCTAGNTAVHICTHRPHCEPGRCMQAAQDLAFDRIYAYSHEGHKTTG